MQLPLPGVPNLPAAQLPECHAEGLAPEGYAPGGPCTDCRDKFSCLPATIAKGLGQTTLDVDQEVLAVARGVASYADMIKRMLLRVSYGKAPIPVALRPTTPIEPPKARDKREWKARPGVLSAQQMREHLVGSHSYKNRGVRIGQPFALQVGMQLVRKKSDGTERVVLLRENGFEVSGEIYPSLSTAAIAIERRSVSGNEFFNLRHRQVEIRAADGAVLIRGGTTQGVDRRRVG